MKYIKTYLLLLFIFAFSFATPFGVLKAQNIFNAPLPDNGDSLQVFTPVADSIVKGNINISFNIVDDDVDGVEYTVGLFDSNNCSNLVGNIASNIGEGNINIGWNTRTTQSTSNLQDGVYCLKICTALQNGSTPYSACNGRRINVLNNNTKPVITSTLNKIQYLNGENFSYQLRATDAEGDPLTYRLVSTPAFLSINKNTGLITSNGTLNTNGAYGLQYTVTVGVSDGKSGETFQTFQFSVYSEDPNAVNNNNGGNNNGGGQSNQGGSNGNNQNNPPPTENNDDSEDEDEDEETPEEEPEEGNISDFDFIDLEEDSVISESPYTLRWSYGESVHQVESSNLQFSGDGESWNEIASDLTPDQNAFQWDVSSLTSGEYYVRMVITRTDGEQQIEESDIFVINLQQEGENTNEALITSVSPEPDSEISEVRPTISGNFLPSLDASVDTNTVQITLDGRDISESCNVSDDNSFTCELDEDLDTGRHVVTASFRDSSENSAEREWTFSIVEQNVDSGALSDDDGAGLSQSAILFILLIVGLGLIILVVPWLLYTLWARNNTETKSQTDINYSVTTSSTPQESSEVAQDPYAQFDYDYPDININTNYTPPENTTDPVSTQSNTYTETATNDYIQPYDINVGTEVQQQAPVAAEPNIQTEQPVQQQSAAQQPESSTPAIQLNTTINPQPQAPQQDAMVSDTSVQNQGDYPASDYLQPYNPDDEGGFVEPQKTS